MRTDFGDLTIEQAIVHMVPKSSRKAHEEEADLQLSQATCDLTQTVRTEVQAKLRNALAASSREIIEDPEAKSELPDRVRDFLAGRDGVVEISQSLAYLLHKSQTGSNSAGLLLVATATLGGQPALLAVKLEQETGMQARSTVKNGLRTIDMEYFADLFLTEKSRVFKVALFTAAGVTDDGLEGWAADKQMAGKQLARFFLEKFLGCRHKDEPREITRRFYHVAFNWANEHVKDPDTRVRYTMAVLSELQSTHTTLDPNMFIRSHLQPKHRDEFAAYLLENKVPLRVFDKDTELIDSKLQKLRMEFASGVFLVAPLTAFEDDIVVIEEMGDGRSRVVLTDTLTTTRGFAQGGRPATTPGDDSEAERK
ncbi:MAG: hypothetical protein JWL97_4386 [Gemmatimonadales bacterium]|nr:hypothetical protein [Gemmatimonadales bacterium]